MAMGMSSQDDLQVQNTGVKIFFGRLDLLRVGGKLGVKFLMGELKHFDSQGADFGTGSQPRKPSQFYSSRSTKQISP